MGRYIPNPAHASIGTQRNPYSDIESAPYQSEQLLGIKGTSIGDSLELLFSTWAFGCVSRKKRAMRP